MRSYMHLDKIDTGSRPCPTVNSSYVGVPEMILQNRTGPQNTATPVLLLLALLVPKKKRNARPVDAERDTVLRFVGTE